jgi:glycosyltransferase involved in cell wall biosynthesis
MVKIESVDICVVTYNRLEYLKICVWSILASTSIKYRLFVISDNSTDGTNEWLLEMKKHGKIDEVIINEENLGTAKSFNKVINATTSDWFVMTCDDMYFHRGWDKAAIGLVNEFPDCGIATFYDSILNDKNGIKNINKHSYKIKATGLGSAMINKKLFKIVNGFYLPEGLKMGYLAGNFCIKASQSKQIRNKQYCTIPPYSIQMNKSKLTLEYLYSDYNKRRKIEKDKFRKK